VVIVYFQHSLLGKINPIDLMLAQESTRYHKMVNHGLLIAVGSGRYNNRVNFGLFFLVIYKQLPILIITKSSMCIKCDDFQCSVLCQLLEPFDAVEVVEHICRALKHHEVNWKCLLSLTAVMLTTCHDAGQHVQSSLLLCFFSLSLSFNL